jgi:RimJ/RimL family protein N-acetyltransferase
MPWATDRQTEEEAERLAREFRGRWLLARDFVIGVFSPDGSELMGGCGYHLREGGLGVRAAEMGMWIRASRAGQGIGTRVLRALLRWGFSDDWPWERLTWRCDARNLASTRIAEKAGMRREGVLRGQLVEPDGGCRDTVCYALLRGEFGAGTAADDGPERDDQ